MRLTDYPFVPSPNVSSRRGRDVTATVIHYTASGGGMQAEGDVSWLVNPSAKASAHFVIGRAGDVTQLVELHMAAWHAGASVLDGRRGCNLFTLGIELDNCGLLHQSARGRFYWEAGRSMRLYRGLPPEEATHGDVTGWWEPYPKEQIEALRGLLGKLRGAGYHEAVSRIVGHDEVAVPQGRKLDPGPLFPWTLFRGGGA